MKTQSDTEQRVVNLTNLEAMCDRVSGFCHRFTVTKVTKTRVYVEYSNPDEWAHDQPVTAVFPCYPNQFDDDGSNPDVVLQILRVIGDPGDRNELWQAYFPLLECPRLWRSPDTQEWKTREEWEATK